MHATPSGDLPSAGGQQALPEVVARHYVARLTGQLHDDQQTAPSRRTDSGRGGPTMTIRPYGNPLPLGFFSFAIGMVLLAGSGLGWLVSAPDLRTAGILMAAFVFPLELLATVFALLTRDTAAAAVLGLYSTVWLATGTVTALVPTDPTSRPVGLLLGGFTVVLIPLAVTAAFGKTLLSLVLVVSAARAGFDSAYRLGGPHWTDRASGIGALILFALACYAGTAFLVEDLRGASGLTGRRGRAAAAMSTESTESGDDLADRPGEPGVREQL
jgi:hypothetical protein